MNVANPKTANDRHGYVYITTFTRPTDGRIFYYVGQKLGNKINRKYCGSGLRIHNLINKYGKSGNVHVKVLDWTYSQEELNFKETLCIGFAKQEYGKDCINIMYGGANGHTSMATRRKMRTSALARPPKSAETIEKHRAKILGKSQSDEHVAKRMKAHVGAKRSEVTKQRQRDAWLTRNPDSYETRLKKSLSQLGRVMSPESNAKKSASLKGRIHETVVCPRCKKTGAKPGMVRWHFDNCIY